MTAARQITSSAGDGIFDETLFALIAGDIESQGYSIRPCALPTDLSISLSRHLQDMSSQKFERAGIGRNDEYLRNRFVRTDKICWITGESEAGRHWLEWASDLKEFLNRRLFLGLFSFESHFAHYGIGDFYKRHYDAFRGEANRVLSVVAYLNADWAVPDGGELVLYSNDHDREGIRVVPLMGTLVVFLSEEFPHEVLPASRDRYSIAGWYRVNASINGRLDPPL